MTDLSVPVPLQTMDTESSFSESRGSLNDNTTLLTSVTHGSKRLSVLVAALFIAGDLAGVGVLALPYAVEQTGFIGLVLIVVFGATAAYTGSILGHAWTIIEDRFSNELQGHNQDPYPILGEKSFGKRGRIVVQICSYTAIFGGCVVFLLLASDLTSDIVQSVSGNAFSPCYIVLIIGAILVPLSWLGTPIDFWPLGVAALISTTLASIQIACYTIYLRHDQASLVKHGDIEVEGFFLAMGSIAFTFSGHPSFPTIQQDMAEKSKFGLAAVMAFSGVVGIYLTVTISTYVLLGDVITASDILTTLSSIEHHWTITGAEILLLLHLVTCFLVVLNPLSQDLERFFNVANSFGPGRVVIRTVILVFIMFTAESLPRFGVLLSLVGGTAITMIILVLPVCIYERLCRQTGEWPYVGVAWYKTAYHSIIIVLSTILIVASTYGGVRQISSPDSFVPPCYVNISAAHF